MAILLLLLGPFVYKFVDSSSCFPYNSMIDALRISLGFWQSRGLKLLPEFQDFLLSRSLVPAKNAPF